jgi:type II secretory pathway component GspD/PulD (secretin)
MNAHRLTIRALLSLTLLPISLAAHAQSADTKQAAADCSKLQTHAEKMDCEDAHSQIKTIYLKNVSTPNDATEILVAIRNVSDPGLKIFLVASQNGLVIDTYPEQFAKIEALVHALDIPHKTYRLTYTITELDAGKTLGTEHIAMVVVDGQRTTVKQGDKVPVATGSYSADNNSAQTQFTYLDIGLNFDATLSALENGAILKTKVEQSSLGTPSTIANVTEPVVRQTVLEGNTFLTLGKPVMIGSIDVPNSTHRFDIAVVMDPIK